MRKSPFAIVLACLLGCASVHAQQLITSGPELDYQPAVIKTSDGVRIVVFERLSPPPDLSGDLWITRSTDGGTTWSEPAAIIATVANERHPALIETSAGHFVLFYLKGTGSTTSFRLWRATSSDGATFGDETQLDLGWATGGEINPHVIRHADGTLTMSYQRLGSGAGVYVAQSVDDGVTWDLLKTQISDNAQLPRITFRESDGLYLATYQRGSSALHILAKTTTDVRDWTGAEQNFALDVNNHDSLPIVMPDDAFVVFWIRANGDFFDILVRRSIDSINWGPILTVTNSPAIDDVEPHPLVGASANQVELYWGRDDPGGSFTYDIVREAAVVVNDVVFAASFDH